MLRDFLSSREYMTRRNGSLPRFVVGIRENVSSSLSVSLPSSRIQHFCFVIAIILRVEIIFSVLCGTLSVLLSKCLFLFFSRVRTYLDFRSSVDSIYNIISYDQRTLEFLSFLSITLAVLLFQCA